MCLCRDQGWNNSRDGIETENGILLWLPWPLVQRLSSRLNTFDKVESDPVLAHRGLNTLQAGHQGCRLDAGC